MARITLLLLLILSSFNSFSQSYDCPSDAIGGLPADDIYTTLASYSSNCFVAAQTFINLDTLDFEAISVIGLRHNGNWEECEDQNPLSFKIDFWSYENLLPDTLIESIDDASIHIDSLDTWTLDDKDWVLERFTFTFKEARNYKLGFISIYNEDEAPNNTCKFNWLYNYPDNINLEGATIHDDGTKVIWNAFNFCLLAEGIVIVNSNLSHDNSVRFFPNPVSSTLHFENNGSFEKIEIFNSLGILVYSDDLINSASTEAIKVHHLASGTYIARLINVKDQSISTEIFVK
jgi:hypothetical protein